jgi:hypothetical protein
LARRFRQGNLREKQTDRQEILSGPARDRGSIDKKQEEKARKTRRDKRKQEEREQEGGKHTKKGRQ